ncbi:putative transcriptional regulator, LysR family protein [Parvularcula bermudensis HTCC2503]|uniref:Putative transcriptional regulator, LysR family protein n=1 Tax=Parvularcula bermudensis (strain ATCC BAA-594 / HTCC2503 / KCTC 12087) TaxID=314260 RepID=E0TH06_PARBH|nr:putative transcriptional regulator, LysR family protein [Parvularcula bermudensis HTCC2503]
MFVAVAEAGSFAGAGRKLGVTKSAVSKRIGQLEAQLGVKLFTRSTRAMTLTEAGERYRAHAALALEAGKQAEDAATALQDSPAGRLQILAPMSFGRLHIAPLMAGFLLEFPDIEADLALDDRHLDLVEQGFDVAVRAGQLHSPTLITRKLTDLHSVLCASPEYLASHAPPRAPADLDKHNCLHFAHASDAHHWSFRKPGEPTVRVETRGSYQTSNSEALMDAVLGGLGIARLPTFIAGPAIAQGQLHHLLSDFEMPSQPLSVIYPERRYLPVKVRAFTDFIVEHLGTDHPEWDRF